ncbi:hypothetical protein PNI0446_02399 [Streptococcus pneumoniae PNI0446]|nr:hypothetical protein PNI0446_02399 [Streptococcus pneumoniae PNI0446]
MAIDNNFIICSFRGLIFSYTLRKSLQTASTSPCRIDVTDFVSSICNLKTVF